MASSNDIALKLSINAREALEAVRSVEASVKDAARAARDGFNVKPPQGLAEPFESAARSVERARKSTEALGDETEKTTRTASTLAERFAKIGFITNGIQNLAGSFSTLGQPLVELDAGLRAIGTLGVKNFQEFQSAALELSRTFPDTAATIANAVADAVGSGLVATDQAGRINIEQAKNFAAQASQLAVAGATDIGTAVKGLGSVINSYSASLQQYGDVSQQAAYVSDVLFNTYNLGVVSVSELATNLSQVTGVAATAGVGIDQVGAAIATLTKQGAQGGVATTRIRALIQEILAGKDKLAPVTTELAKQFAALEKPIESTGKMYDKTRTLQENLKAGTITLQDVAEGIGRVAAQQGKEITNIFGSIEAAQAVLALSGTNAKMAFEDLAQIAQRGTTAEGFAVQADSIENRVKTMVNTVNAAFISAFQALGKGASATLSAVSQLSPAITALTGIQQLIPPSAFEGLKRGFSEIPRLAQSALSGTLGLSGGIGSMFSEIPRRASEALRGLPAVIAGTGKVAATGLVSSVASGFRALPSVAAGVVQSAKTALLQAPAALGGAFQAAFSSIAAGAQSAFSGVASAGASVARGLAGLFTAPLATISAGFTALGGAARAAWLAVTGPVGITIAAIAAVGTALYALYANFDDVKKAVNGFITAVISTATQIADTLKPLLSDVGSLLKEIGSLIVDVVVSAFRVLSGIVGTVVGAISTFVGGLFGLRSETQKTGESTSLLTRAIQFLRDVVQAAQNNIAGFISAIRSIRSTVSDVANSLLSGNFSRALEAFSNAPANAAAAFKTGFQEKEVSRVIEQAFAGLDATVAKLASETKKQVEAAVQAGNIEDAKVAINSRLQAEIAATKKLLEIQTASADQRKQLEQQVAQKQAELRKKAADDIEKLLSSSQQSASGSVSALEALKTSFQQIKQDLAQGADVTQVVRDAKALFREVNKAGKQGKISLTDQAQLQREIEEFQKSLQKTGAARSKAQKDQQREESDALQRFLDEQQKKRLDAERKTSETLGAERLAALEREKAAIEKNETLTAAERIQRAVAVERAIIEEKARVQQESLTAESAKRRQALASELAAVAKAYAKGGKEEIAKFFSDLNNLQPPAIATFLEKSTTLSKEKIAEVVQAVQQSQALIETNTAQAAQKLAETTRQQLEEIERAAALKLPQAQLQDEIRRINQTVLDERSRAAQIELLQVQAKADEEVAIIARAQERIRALRAASNTATGAPTADGAAGDTSALMAQQAAEYEALENRKTQIARQAAARRNEIMLEEFIRTGKIGDEQVTTFSKIAGKTVGIFRNITNQLRASSGGDVGKRLAELNRRKNQELAIEGKTAQERLAIQKKYADEEARIQRETGLPSILGNIRNNIADTLRATADESRATFGRAAESAKSFADISGEAWGALAESLGATFASLAADGISPLKALVLGTLSALEALVPVFVAMITGQSLGQAGPVAGPVLAAVATATLYGLLAAAKSAVAAAKFERGGLVQGGVHDGRTGRVITVNERGQEFVVNHRATAKNLRALTEVNRRNITFEQYFREQRAARPTIESPLQWQHFQPEFVAVVARYDGRERLNQRIVERIEEQTEALETVLETRLAALERAMERTAREFRHQTTTRLEISADPNEMLRVQQKTARRHALG